MPIMDGMEATTIIRKLEMEREASAGYYAPRTPSYGRGTPPLSSVSNGVASPHRPHVIILALTASSLHKDRVAALGAGCDDFLTKPVSMNWLNDKILEWGSMQALRMWGTPLEPLPIPVGSGGLRVLSGSLQSNQVARAASVAGALQIPKGRSNTPSPVRRSDAASRKHGRAAGGHMGSTVSTPLAMVTTPSGNDLRSPPPLLGSTSSPGSSSG